MARNVEVLNYALADIPAEQARVHVCWGNYAGPHNRDVPVKEIIDLLLELRVKKKGGVSKSSKSQKKE